MALSDRPQSGLAGSSPRDGAHAPPVIISCSVFDSATVEEAAGALRSRGYVVEVVSGVDGDVELLATAIREFVRQGLYVLCRSPHLDRTRIDRLRTVLRAHEVPFGRTLTLAIEPGEARALEDRVISVVRRMITGRGDSGPHAALAPPSRAVLRPPDADEDHDRRMDPVNLTINEDEIAQWADSLVGKTIEAPEEEAPSGPARPGGSASMYPVGAMGAPCNTAAVPDRAVLSERNTVRLSDEGNEIASIRPAVATPMLHHRPEAAMRVEHTQVAPMPQPPPMQSYPSEMRTHNPPVPLAAVRPRPSVSPSGGVTAVPRGPVGAGSRLGYDDEEDELRGSKSKSGLWLGIGAVVVVLGIGIAVVRGVADNGEDEEIATQTAEPEQAAAVPAAEDNEEPSAQEPAGADAAGAAGEPVPSEEQTSKRALPKSPAAEDAKAVLVALRTRKVRAMDVFLVTANDTDTITHADAAKHCANLEIAGLGGWRLPEIGELHSLGSAKMTQRGRIYWSATIGDAFGDKRLVFNAKTERIGPVSAGWGGARALCIRERS
jgi:hypothetical protein